MNLGECFLKNFAMQSIQIKALEECEWLNISLAYLRELELADVLERLLVLLDVLELDPKVPLVFTVLLGQEQSMLEVACLSTDPDGRLYVKVHLSVLGLQ